MYRSTVSLALACALALVACSSDSDDRPVDPSQIRLQIVSGDRQTAQVAGAGASQSVATVAANLQQGPITEADLFPERLVVRAVGVGASPSSAPMGPSLATGASGVPGVSVTWSTRPEGCGRPVEVSKVTDENGEAVNRWVRGTKAGECFMDVCRVLASGEVVCDSTYTATQLPGPVVDLYVQRKDPSVVPVNVVDGDTIDARLLIQKGYDTYGNLVPAEAIRELPDSMIHWSIHTASDPRAVNPVAGTGWNVVFDGLEHFPGREDETGQFRRGVNLDLRIVGATTNILIGFNVFER